MKKKLKININDYFEVIKNEDSLLLKPLLPLTVINSFGYDKLITKSDLFDGYRQIILDFSEVQMYDTYIVLFHDSLVNISSILGIDFSYKTHSDSLRTFIEKFSRKEVKKESKKRDSALVIFFNNVGQDSVEFFTDMKNMVTFFGGLIISLFKLILKPTLMRWKDVPLHFTRAGVNAVFICLLIMLLLGLITGYQGALQLKQFGADIYIADLVAVSITRELSPLMVAILVAGRSGSAFAAEIGTMRVSDEIDALKSMGFDEFQFLVLPRVLSVTFAMPILTIFGDLAGIGGGLMAALGSLNITVTGFLTQLQSSLGLNHLLTGLAKSMIFGFLISSIGCFRGLQVRGGAESVGKYTTMSVVSGILLIIIADAVFTFLFQVIGI